jgi:hypothetical protein
VTKPLLTPSRLQQPQLSQSKRIQSTVGVFLQVISHDIQALNNFASTKESDLGIRITRHIKWLRKMVTLDQVREALPGLIDSGSQLSAATVQKFIEGEPSSFSQTKVFPTSKPAKVYIYTLASVLCLREKQLSEVGVDLLGQQAC